MISRRAFLGRLLLAPLAVAAVQLAPEAPSPALRRLAPLTRAPLFDATPVWDQRFFYALHLPKPSQTVRIVNIVPEDAPWRPA